jgi:hypothetical protein
MKFMLMLFDNPNARESLTPAVMKQMGELMNELSTSGELVDTEALADPSQAQTVTAQDGVPAATDGPFAEAKEHMGGYVVVDCDSKDRAVEIARRWPERLVRAIEVRPFMHNGGEEM